MGRKKIVNYQQIGYICYLGALYINNRWFSVIRHNNDSYWSRCSDVCRYGGQNIEWSKCYEASYEAIGMEWMLEDFCAFYFLLNGNNKRIALKSRDPYSLYKAIRFKIKSRVRSNDKAIKVCKFK